MPILRSRDVCVIRGLFEHGISRAKVTAHRLPGTQDLNRRSMIAVALTQKRQKNMRIGNGRPFSQLVKQLRLCFRMEAECTKRDERSCALAEPSSGTRVR